MNTVHVHRAGLLRFDAAGRAVFDADGALAIEGGRVRASGSWSAVQAALQGEPHATTEHTGRWIAPGFVDMHLHMPQVDVIGSRADGLLPWLEQHTFPHEARFSEAAHAAEVAEFFMGELLRNGVTTALCFGSSHPASAEALFAAAHARGMRLMAGQCLMDSNAPDGVRDNTEQSLLDAERLMRRWHGHGRLGYAITPRFAASCSEAQLAGAGELAGAHPSVWVQSHASENLDEIAWVAQLFPQEASYLAVYDRFGLLRERTVLAHGIHFSDTDRALMRERGAAIAACPTSNQFLGSGNFDFVAAHQQGMLHGLASDVGGGMSFSPFATMRAAYVTARSDARMGHDATTGLASTSKAAVSMSGERLWWLHTQGAANALGLGAEIGGLQPGQEADFLVLNPSATPLLARRFAAAVSLDDALFAMLMHGDDRVIERTCVAASVSAA